MKSFSYDGVCCKMIASTLRVMNDYECTIDQELTALLHIHSADVSFSLARWQHSTVA